MLYTFTQNLKVDPFPSFDYTFIYPPKLLQISLLKFKPSPIPVKFYSIVYSANPNKLKMLYYIFLLIPIPLSDISKVKYKHLSQHNYELFPPNIFNISDLIVLFFSSSLSLLIFGSCLVLKNALINIQLFWFENFIAFVNKFKITCFILL